MSLKSRFFDFFRQFSRIPFIEKLLADRIGKGSHIAQKLIADIHLYPKNSVRICTRNNITYQLDISDYMEHALYFHISNKVDFDRRMLYSLIKKDYICFDIGANIGETTLNFAQIASAGKVYSFEPVPFLFQRLRTNTGLNYFDNIILHNIAISDNTDDLYFDAPKNQNSSGISLNKHSSADATRVCSTTLDTFVIENNIERIDFIKIDVEGFENYVINGAINTIKRFKPVLFIEIDNRYLIPKHTSEKKLLMQLKNDFAYTLYHIDGLQKIKIETIEDTGMHYDVLCIIE